MGVERLKIGVSARIFHPEPDGVGIYGKTLQYVEQSMAHWLMSRDVLVFMVPSIGTDGVLHRTNVRLADYATHLDGLVLQGGADIAPETYGETALCEQWAGDRVRDIYEMELLREFIDAKKPVLGICRGAQMINIAFGGTLYQDVPSQIKDSFAHRHATAYEENYHDIVIEPDTGLARLYPDKRRARVNSIHHQSINRLGSDLVVEAWSEPDHVIEAARWNGPGYVFGVQWHPEFLNPGDGSFLNPTPILDEFLSAVGQRT